MKKKVFGLLIMFFVCLGISGTSLSYTLFLETVDQDSNPKTEFIRGESFYVHVVVDDAAGIAGTAFTLSYPSSFLIPPATTSGGTPVNPGDISSIFPFSFTNPNDQTTTQTHRENSSLSGKILFSGATIDSTDGGARYKTATESMVLFTAKFTAKSDAPLEDFQLSINQSQLLNPAAGWGIDTDSDGTKDAAEPVPVLVGAVDNQDPGWNDLALAYPVLLGGAANPFTPVTYTVSIVDDNQDTDEDGMPDWWEQQYGLNPQADDAAGDPDHDGYSNLNEYLNATIPTIQDEARKYPNWNEATDNRIYQKAWIDPETSIAAAGGNFSVDLMYTTTDNDSSLSGLGLLLHYNSDKVQFIEHSNAVTGLVGVPLIRAEEAGEDDGDERTDKVLVIAWADAVNGNWPGIQLPAKLSTVTFSASSQLQDADSTVLQLTATSVSGTYHFLGSSGNIEIRSWNLDIDGNGTADALTDGLLIIRYLFGLNQGPSLVDRSVDTENGTRTSAEEIAAYLESGKDQGLLDIDCNGAADALTDGLLIIRYLFGLNQGPSLVDRAVDPSGCRNTDDAIASYIEQLKP